MRKIVKILLIILIILILIWLMAFGVDYYRCAHMKEPIFVLKSGYLIEYSDGRKDLTGQGLGYYIAYNTLPTKDGEEVIWVKMQFLDKCILEKTKEVEKETYTKRAVITKVYENSLGIMGMDGENDLYSLGFTEKGNIRI